MPSEISQKYAAEYQDLMTRMFRDMEHAEAAVMLTTGVSYSVGNGGHSRQQVIAALITLADYLVEDGLAAFEAKDRVHGHA